MKKAILSELKRKKLALKKVIHPNNNPVINKSIESKLEMINWFEDVIITQTDIEPILINKINYYKNKNNSSMHIEETCESVNNIEMLEWFLYLYRKELIKCI